MGINWLSYFHLFQAFADKIISYDSHGFTWFRNFTHDWSTEWNYAAEITKVAYAISAILGGLPLPLVYLMSIGFAVTLVLVVIRIVIDLL